MTDNSTEYPPVIEPKFSPLTHCALCGKMQPSIAASVRQQVPIDFTINHTSYWDDVLCNCEAGQ